MRIFSPVGMLILSCIIAAIGSLAGGSLYRYLINERFAYEGTHISLMWITACSIIFLVGCMVGSRIKIQGTNKSQEPSIYFINIILFFILTLHLYAIMILIRSLGGFVAYLYSMIGIGQGNIQFEVYNALRSSSIGSIPLTILPLLALKYYKYLNTPKIIDLGIIIFSCLLYLGVVLPTQNKGPILSLILMLIFIRFYSLWRMKRLKKSKILFYLLGFSLLSILIFYIIQTRRDLEQVGIIGELFGYFFASYNRLTYVLTDNLTMPNQGTGYYTNTWYWTLPGSQSISSILESLQIQIPRVGIDSWFDIFKAVNSVNLNGRYIWVTLYGEVYLDYGFFGLVWFFYYGLFSQFTWKLMLYGKWQGIMIYPLFVIAGLQWFSGANITNRSMLVALAIVALFWASSYLQRRT